MKTRGVAPESRTDNTHSRNSNPSAGTKGVALAPPSHRIGGMDHQGTEILPSIASHSSETATRHRVQASDQVVQRVSDLNDGGMEEEDSILIPPRIALKADNGKYVKPFEWHYRVKPGSPKDWFSGAKEGNLDSKAVYDVENLGNDKIALVDYNNKYMTMHNLRIEDFGEKIEFIMPKDDTLTEWGEYKVIKIDKQRIALKAANNKFVGRLAIRQRQFLEAKKDSISDSATHFSLQLPGFGHEFKDIIYQTSRRNILEKAPLSVVNVTIRNKSKETDKFNISYKYTKSIQGTWSNTFSFGVEVKLTAAAKIPFVAEGGADVTTKIGYQTTTGGSDTITKEVASDAEITVPPESIKKASLIGHQARIRVPYVLIASYTDMAGTTGKTVRIRGVYENLESFDFDWEITRTRRMTPEELNETRRSIEYDLPDSEANSAQQSAGDASEISTVDGDD